jgi:DNA-binding HxlR family transcriptional regulator
MRKQASTNTINKQQLEKTCGMAYTISVISGRWKLSILGFLLNEGTHRYSEIRRKLPGISERMLIAQLKELEKDGLVDRIAYPEVPPRVEYALSEKGRSLEQILNHMSAWGEEFAG